MSVEIVAVVEGSPTSEEFSDRCKALEGRLIDAMGDETLSEVIVSVLGRMFCQTVAVVGTRRDAVEAIRGCWDDMPKERRGRA